MNINQKNIIAWWQWVSTFGRQLPDMLLLRHKQWIVWLILLGLVGASGYLMLALFIVKPKVSEVSLNDGSRGLKSDLIEKMIVWRNERVNNTGDSLPLGSRAYFDSSKSP